MISRGLMLILTALSAATAAAAPANFKIAQPENRGCLNRLEPLEIEKPLSIILTNKYRAWKKQSQRKSTSDPFSELFATPIFAPAEGNLRYDFELTRPVPSEQNPKPKFEVTSRHAMIETYWRPQPTTYRLIPGLGIGASTDSTTWVYFCLYLPDSDQGNEMVIHFLNAQPNPRSNMVDVKTKSIKLELNPVDGLFNLILSPVLGVKPEASTELADFDARLMKRQNTIAGELLKSIIGIAGEVGVERIELNPRDFTLSLRKRYVVFGAKSDKVEKLDSTWMIKAMNQRKVFGKSPTARP